MRGGGQAVFAYAQRIRVRRIVSILILIPLGAAAAWSVHLARADAAFREGTVEGVARAMALVPQNSAYLAVGALQTTFKSMDSLQQKI